MRSVAPITKIVPLFLWSAKMPKIYAKCQKFMQKLWNFIFCHLNIVRAVYKLSFKLLVRSVAQITKIVLPFLWFRGGLCYKHRRIRHGAGENRYLLFEIDCYSLLRTWQAFALVCRSPPPPQFRLALGLGAAVSRGRGVPKLCTHVFAPSPPHCLSHSSVIAQSKVCIAGLIILTLILGGPLNIRGTAYL